MKHQVIVAFLCFLAFGHFQHCEAEPLDFDVSPREIIPSFTKMMTANCTFKSGADSNFTNLLTISVSRSDLLDNQSQELVSINIFSPNRVSVLSDVYNASVSGHIDSGNDSYLRLQWSYPSGVEAGLYQCQALAMDDTGHILVITKSVQVTAHPPNFDELIIKITQLQVQLDQEIQTNILLQSQLDLLMKLMIHFEISPVYSNHYYLLSKNGGEAASVAEAACEEFGGYLAEIDDAIEYAFIKEFVDPVSRVSYIMLGGTDEASEGAWLFLRTGLPVVFTAWQSGEPNQDIRDCMGIYRGYQWAMYDEHCTTPSFLIHFLCEVPLVLK